MNISGINSVSAAHLATAPADAVSLAVLKRAMAIEAESSLALIDTIPAPQSLPSHLGQHVNTVA